MPAPRAVAHLFANVRRNHKKKSAETAPGSSTNSGREARAAPVGVGQTLPDSHSVVAQRVFPMVHVSDNFSATAQLVMPVFNSVGGTSFQPFVSAARARDEDTDSPCTDDIADDDADDVAHV